MSEPEKETYVLKLRGYIVTMTIVGEKPELLTEWQPRFEPSVKKFRTKVWPVFLRWRAEVLLKHGRKLGKPIIVADVFHS